MADINKDTTDGELISVEQVVRDHWSIYGRNYYQRYDYEALTTEQATEIFNLLSEQLTAWNMKTEHVAVNFSYTDPVDKSISAN